MLIGFCFSALLLVLSLLGAVHLAAVEDRAAALEWQCEHLREENAVLEAEYERSISLEEIERYAVEVFGMQRWSTAQSVYIEYPGD